MDRIYSIKIDQIWIWSWNPDLICVYSRRGGDCKCICENNPAIRKYSSKGSGALHNFNCFCQMHLPTLSGMVLVPSNHFILNKSDPTEIQKWQWSSPSLSQTIPRHSSPTNSVHGNRINTCTLFKVPTFSCTLDHVAKFWVERIVVVAGLWLF